MTKLHAGEVRLPDGRIMTSREWASEILDEVANATHFGGFPAHVSAFDLGRALSRSLVNCQDENAYKELLRGFEHTEGHRG